MSWRLGYSNPVVFWFKSSCLDRCLKFLILSLLTNREGSAQDQSAAAEAVISTFESVTVWRTGATAAPQAKASVFGRMAAEARGMAVAPGQSRLLCYLVASVFKNIFVVLCACDRVVSHVCPVHHDHPHCLPTPLTASQIEQTSPTVRPGWCNCSTTRKRRQSLAEWQRERNERQCLTGSGTRSFDRQRSWVSL